MTAVPAGEAGVLGAAPARHRAIAATAPALRLEHVEAARFAETAEEFADLNLRQTPEYAVHAAEHGRAAIEFVAMGGDGATDALAAVRVWRLPWLGGGVAYVSGGPLVRRGGRENPTLAGAAADALRREYSARRGLVLRVAPPVGAADWNRDVAAALSSAGFRPVADVPRYRTLLLDVARPPSELRRSLRQKWRNCLNKAERSGIEVRAARDVDSVERFRGLFDAFVERKGFGVRHGAAFHAALQARLPESRRLRVLLAERGGRLVAGHLSASFGDTSVYLLGATSPEALSCCAAYLLQWRAVEAARESGCRWYDLGGIDPRENPGVFRFKEGMRGIDVTAAGPVGCPGARRSSLLLSLALRFRALREAATKGRAS